MVKDAEALEAGFGLCHTLRLLDTGDEGGDEGGEAGGCEGSVVHGKGIPWPMLNSGLKKGSTPVVCIMTVEAEEL